MPLRKTVQGGFVIESTACVREGDKGFIGHADRRIEILIVTRGGWENEPIVVLGASVGS